jgi:signal transduction histidine kinase
VRPHLLAAAREGLANAARHAHASQVSFDVAVMDGQVVLSVVDNGMGVAPGRAHSGLANVRNRAQAVGGELTVDATNDGGTRLVWRAPLGGSGDLGG